MKTRFILNSRSGAPAAALDAVRRYVASRGAELVFTERSGHAAELTARAVAEGCETIVAVGGDGTLNEVAGQLVGTKVVFGLVPCGSGNGLGRHLGIHGPIEHALDILRTARSRAIDSGLADGHPFFTVAGLGFEAELSGRFNRSTHRGLGGYLATAARMIGPLPSVECTIEAEGRVTPMRVFTLAVANSDQYGNNLRIAPGARVDDGQLDLVAVPAIRASNALPLLTRFFTGTTGRSPGVLRLRSTRFVVERPAPRLIHTDGETHLAGARVEFIIRPGSLHVLAPPDHR